MNGMILSPENEIYDSENLRAAFLLFMQHVNSTVKPKTLSTYCSDALFIWSQLPDRWVWQIVDDTTISDKDWQARLKNYIRQDITAARSCPDKDARSYTKHFWQLIIFLRIFRCIEKGQQATPRRIGE